MLIEFWRFSMLSNCYRCQLHGYSGSTWSCAKYQWCEYQFISLTAVGANILCHFTIMMIVVYKLHFSSICRILSLTLIRLHPEELTSHLEEVCMCGCGNMCRCVAYSYIKKYWCFHIWWTPSPNMKTPLFIIIAVTVVT